MGWVYVAPEKKERRRLTEQDILTLLALSDRGANLTSIAFTLDRKPSTIHSFCSRQGIMLKAKRERRKG